MTNPFPKTTDAPQPTEPSPEAEARFEARIKELRDRAFWWFESLGRRFKADQFSGRVCLPFLNDRDAGIIIQRILDDGLPCSEDQCETLAREIIEEDGPMTRIDPNTIHGPIDVPKAKGSTGMRQLSFYEFPGLQSEVAYDEELKVYTISLKTDGNKIVLILTPEQLSSLCDALLASVVTTPPPKHEEPV